MKKFLLSLTLSGLLLASAGNQDPVEVDVLSPEEDRGSIDESVIEPNNHSDYSIPGCLAALAACGGLIYLATRPKLCNKILVPGHSLQGSEHGFKDKLWQTPNCMCKGLFPDIFNDINNIIELEKASKNPEYKSLTHVYCDGDFDSMPKCFSNGLPKMRAVLNEYVELESVKEKLKGYSLRYNVTQARYDELSSLIEIVGLDSYMPLDFSDSYIAFFFFANYFYSDFKKLLEAKDLYDGLNQKTDDDSKQKIADLKKDFIFNRVRNIFYIKGKPLRNKKWHLVENNSCYRNSVEVYLQNRPR